MPATSAPSSLARVRFPVEKLQYGMYVAELDRPWLDTPFLLEGMLLRDQTELATLRQYCQHVYVDLWHSADGTAEAIRAVASGAAPRNDERAPAGGVSAPARSAPAAPSVSKLDLPAGLRLKRYAEPAPIETALPRAAKSWSRGADTLRTLMNDLRDDNHSELRDVDQVAEDLVASMIETPDAMLWVARLRSEDQGAYQHCLKVAIYLIALGRHMGFPREDLVRLGLTGMLADVGKIQLPRGLLEKPDMLTPSEHDVVKTHVHLGIGALLKSMTLDPNVEQGILQHHERIDGSGYPQGLKGREISIYGRMAAIADCFAAMITDRPYAKALAPQEALMLMNKWCGTSFHEPLVEQFVQAIGVFPVGSLVELSNDEIAVVLAHNRVRRLEPRVLVLAGPDRKQLDTPFERDLLIGPVDSAGNAIHIARGLPAGAHGLKPRDYYAEEAAPRDEPLVAAG